MRGAHTLQSLESEQSTLGACLIDPKAIKIVRAALPVADAFYNGTNRKIYEVLLSMDATDDTIDIVTVAEKLFARKQLDDIGGSEYLSALIEACPSSVNSPAYTRVVSEKYVRRQMIAQADAICAMALNEEVPLAQTVEGAQKAIFAISGGRTLNRGLRHVSESMLEVYSELMDGLSNRGQVAGLKTGFTDLDNLTGGYAPGTVNIIGARPGMGKTSLALQIVVNAAREGKTGAVFSLEMSEKALTQRMVCVLAGVSWHSAQRGFLSDEESGRLEAAMRELMHLPIYLRQSSNIPVHEMGTHLRDKCAEIGKLDVVVVDYLQLLAGPEKKFGSSRNDDLSAITRDLSALALEMDCPFIVPAQLSRKVEEREDKRPMMSDLRDSGSIEAEAWTIAFLYRASYYQRKDAGIKDWMEDATDETEVILAKHRSGPTGAASLGFQPRYTRFVNFEQTGGGY